MCARDWGSLDTALSKTVFIIFLLHTVARLWNEAREQNEVHVRIV